MVRMMARLMVVGIIVCMVAVSGGASSWEMEGAGPNRTFAVDGAVQTTISSAVVDAVNVSGVTGSSVSDGSYVFVASEQSVHKLNASDSTVPTGEGVPVDLSVTEMPESDMFVQNGSHDVTVELSSSVDGRLFLRLHNRSGHTVDSSEMVGDGTRYSGELDVPAGVSGRFFVSVGSSVDFLEEAALPGEYVEPMPKLALGDDLFVLTDRIRRIDTEDMSEEDVTDKEGFTYLTVANGTVYGYHEDEERLYQYDAADLSSPEATSRSLFGHTPAVAGGRVYMSNESGWMFALDSDDVSVVEASAPSGGQYPMVYRNNLYVSTVADGHLLRLNMSDLSVEERHVYDASVSPPVGTGDSVIQVTADDAIVKLPFDSINSSGQTVSLPSEVSTTDVGLASDGNRVYTLIDDGIYSFDLDAWGGYTKRTVEEAGTDSMGEGFGQPIVTNGSLVAPSFADRVFQLSPDDMVGGWSTETQLLPSYTYDEQIVVLTQLLNANGRGVSPAECEDVFVRYRYPDQDSTQMNYVNGSNGYYMARMDRIPGEGTIDIEGEGVRCAFSDGAAVETVKLRSYSSPGYAVPINVQEQLEGNASLGGLAGCREDGTDLICEKGGNISISFSASTNTADTVVAELRGNEDTLARTSLTGSDGQWSGWVQVPVSLDTGVYGENVSVVVNASNDLSFTADELAFDIAPMDVRVDVSARKQSQGNQVQFQIYPETPYSGGPVPLDDISSVAINVTGPSGSMVVNETIDEGIGDVRQPDRNRLRYNYSIPADAPTGMYAVNVSVGDVFGANASGVTEFEVLAIEDICPAVTDDLCILTEQIQEKFDKVDGAFLYVSVQNLGNESMNVSVEGRGGLASLVEERSYEVGRSVEDLPVPLSLNRDLDGRYTGQLAVGAGSLSKFIPAGINVSFSGSNVSLRADTTDFGTVVAGEVVRTSLTIMNTGSGPINDISISSDTFLIDKELDGSLPLEAGASLSQTIQIDTSDITPGQKEDDIVVETDNAGDARVTLAMEIVSDRLDSIQELEDTVDSVEESIQELEDAGANDTDDFVSTLSSVRSTTASARVAWENERFEEAAEKIQTAEETLTELEDDVSRARQEVEDAEQEDPDPNPDPVEQSDGSGTGMMMWIGVLLLVGLVGAVLYLSIVPEEEMVDSATRIRR